MSALQCSDTVRKIMITTEKRLKGLLRFTRVVQVAYRTHEGKKRKEAGAKSCTYTA